jgi:hypothetical protein
VVANETTDGINCSWLYVLGTTSDQGRAKIGVAHKDVLERFGNLRTADPGLYIELAFLLPDWYTKKITEEETRWHNFFSDPKKKGPISRNIVLGQHTNTLSNSARIIFDNGNESEWFTIKPKDAACIITEHIKDMKLSVFGTLMVMVDNGFVDGPFANDDRIWAYTYDALLYQFKPGLYTGSSPIMPIVL